MRRPIIAGNWKMNKTKVEAENFVNEFKGMVKGVSGVDVVLCVPFTDIEKVKKSVKGTKIKVGAQNVAWADSGAFTGEISAMMLKEVGAEYVIIGHSERRQYFGETDETVNARTAQALKNDLIPIVCVGETLVEREEEQTERVLKTQVEGALKNFTEEDVKKIIIAYEPVWAIGTGKTATAQQANDAIRYIRKVVSKMFGVKVANRVRIQYGGSMNAKNAKELMAMSDIDGGLIGGASLKPEDFSIVVSAGAEA